MNRFRVRLAVLLLITSLATNQGCKDDDKGESTEPQLLSIDAPCYGTPITLHGENLTIAVPYIDDVEVPVIGTPTETEMLIDAPVVDLDVHYVKVESSLPEHSGYESPEFPYSADGFPVAIDNIDPASGPACGGEFVEIHGDNFFNDYSVIARASDGAEDDFFAVQTRVDETLITGITAPHDPGTYEVIVRNLGTCASDASDNYTFEDLQCTGILTETNLQAVEVGPGPQAVAIGDVSNDDNNDVVVGSNSPGLITVLRGNGGGAFTEYEVELETGDTPIALAIADIDEDGRNDVVAASEATRRVRVLLQNDSGTLEYRSDIEIAVGSSPDDAVAVDGNGDGHIDVITANGSGLSVFWGNGDGTFDTELDVAYGGISIAARDYRDNVEGAADLVTASALHVVYSMAWTGSEWDAYALTTAGFTPVAVLIEEAGTVVDTATTYGAGADALVLGTGPSTLGILYGVEDANADYFLQHELSGTPVAFEPIGMYMGAGFEFQVLIALESGTVEVLAKVGDGSDLEITSSLDLGAEPFSLATGKLDGGDKDDFAVGMASGDQIYIHIAQ